MTIETATYISSLNAANPAATDPKSEGDDHIRLLKSTVKATFPNVSGAVTPTHTELNYVAGVTSAIQTQINTKTTNSAAAITGGTINNAVIGGVTPAAGTFTNVTATGNATLGDAEASDTHAIKGATTLLANSASAALTITQTGAGNALVVEDSTSPDATPFVIDAAGRVVVGNTSALTDQYFNGFLQLASTAGTNATTNQAVYSTSSSTFPYQIFSRSNNATIGAHGIAASGDGIGQILFTASDGATQIRAASIQAAVDGTPGTNDMPGRLVFSTTADGASSPTEAMRIDSKQNVGIGAAGTAINLRIAKNITGAVVSYGVLVNGEVQSDVTNVANGFRTGITTAATAFTLADLVHFYADQGTIGAGSAVTNQYGFYVRNTLTGATNNYGYYSNIASGTGRYNFYAAGTAANYFAGETTVNSGLTIGRTAVTAPAATDGNVYSGTYTPTLTNTTNITSSTASACQYMCVGSTVTVSGSVAITPTAASAITLGMSLPIASNLAAATQLGGTGVANNGLLVAGFSGDATNDRATVVATPTSTTGFTYYFTFTYRVI